MYKLTNRLSQPINLIVEGNTIVLKQNSPLIVNKLTTQMKNLNKRWFIRICKVKNKK